MTFVLPQADLLSASFQRNTALLSTRRAETSVTDLTMPLPPPPATDAASEVRISAFITSSDNAHAPQEFQSRPAPQRRRASRAATPPEASSA